MYLACLNLCVGGGLVGRGNPSSQRPWEEGGGEKAPEGAPPRPDYVLVHADVVTEFRTLVRRYIAEFYGERPEASGLGTPGPGGESNRPLGYSTRISLYCFSISLRSRSRLRTRDTGLDDNGGPTV